MSLELNRNHIKKEQTMSTEVEKFVEKPEAMRLYQQERSIIQVTELACDLMRRSGINRTSLARRLKKTPSFVTQLLSGEANMTIRTISDVFTVLGYELLTYASPITIGKKVEIIADVEPSPKWDTGEWSASRDSWNSEVEFNQFALQCG